MISVGSLFSGVFNCSFIVLRFFLTAPVFREPSTFATRLGMATLHILAISPRSIP